MRACLAFFRMRLQSGLQYRVAALAGIVTQFFWGGMEIGLYRAFYEGAPGKFPMAFSALVSYIWLRQAFLALLNTWTYENELFDAILSGNVAYELCRPCSLCGMWFARTLALRLSRAALRCGPILVLAALLPAPWRLSLPASGGAFALFAASLLLSAFVGSALCLLVYFSCFFTVSSEGTRSVLLPVAELLSGSLIPLPMMPDGLAKAMALSPFGALSNAPLRIYSGDLAGADAWLAVGLQVFWLIVMLSGGAALQRRGLRRLCVQGG